MANQRQTVKYMMYCIVLQLLVSFFVTAGERVNFRASLMSRDEVIAYFKAFLYKSSLDMKDEKQLTLEDYAEDLYNKIDGLMSPERYLKLLAKTRSITDKAGNRKYLGSPRTPCNPSSIFKPALQTTLKDWDKSNMLDELEKWQLRNEHVPDSEQCNRFKGLTCQDGGASDPVSSSDSEHSPSTATCQCDGDPSEVGFFKSAEIKTARKQADETYPDGCYVKPWKPCTQLFSQDSSKIILAQIIFPVDRTHKSNHGSNCLDLIPGMNKPICWCNPDSLDEECKLTKDKSLTNVYIPSLDAELLATRRKFIKMVISASDKKPVCNSEYNNDIMNLVQSAGMDPSKCGAVAIMEKLVRDAHPGKQIRVCDFRKALLCDVETRTCKQYLSCGTSLCAPNYICGEESGNKVCLPDCKSPVFEGSIECSEDVVNPAKGRYLIDGVETPEHNEGSLYLLSPGLDSALTSSQDLNNNINPRVASRAKRASPTTTTTIPTTTTNPTSSDSTTLVSTTDVSTVGPKLPGPYGSACQDKTDCDYEKFLACYGGRCLCMTGLAFDWDIGTCHVQTNELCGNFWLKELVISGHDLTAVPTTPAECHSKDQCQEINDHTFCRPKREEGVMFISKARLDKLKLNRAKRKSGCSYAGILRSSKVLLVASHMLYYVRWM